MARELSYDEILEIQARIQSGQFDEEQFYQDLALSNAAEASDFKVDGAVGSFAGLIGFAMFGWLGAAGVGVMLLARIFQKVSYGGEISHSIETGNVDAIAAYLPPLEKQQYMTAKAKAAVAAAEKQEAPQQVQPVEATPAQPPSSVPQIPLALQPSPLQPQQVHHTIELLRPPTIVMGEVSQSTPQAIPQPIIETSLQTVNETPTVEEPPLNCDTAQKVADMGVRSLLWVGGSGTAKSLTATTALKKLKAADPSVQIWCISAKCDETESGYWSGFDRYSFYDFLTCSKAQMTRAFMEWAGIIREFKAYQGKGMLLFDELSLIMSYAKNIKNDYAAEFREEFEMFMLGMSSAGRSTGKGVWGISPSGALNALGGLTKAQLGAFMCAFNAQLSDGVVGFNHGVWVDASNNGMAPQRVPSADDERKAKDAGCTLLTGFNGQWFPTMAYPVPPQDPSIIRLFVRGQIDPPTPEEAQPKQAQNVPGWVHTPRDIEPPPTPLSGMAYAQHPQTLTGHDAGDLRELVERERIRILDGVIQGKSKTQLTKELGLSPGGNAAYQRFSDIYDQFKQQYGRLSKGGGAL